MQVIWTPKDLDSFEAVIVELFLDWNIETIERFENQVEELINRIENHNHICPKTNVKDLHKCVVNKHNSLLYRTKNQNCIEIIIIVFNKSEHGF